MEEKQCKNRKKTFDKVTALLNEINNEVIYQGVRFDIRTEYAIEYLEQITEQYIRLTNINSKSIVRGRGHHKTKEQRNSDKLVEYTDKLKKYATHIMLRIWIVFNL